MNKPEHNNHTFSNNTSFSDNTFSNNTSITHNTSALKRHLTDEDFLKWDSGQMTPAEMEFFLSHTSSCDTCAERWMNWMEQTEVEMNAETAAEKELNTETAAKAIPQPPAYLAEEILERCKQPDILIARNLNRTSRQLQLFTYSLKIGTAVVLSIMMLFSINLTSLKIASVSEPVSVSISQTDRELKELQESEEIQKLWEKQQQKKLENQQEVLKMQEEKAQKQQLQSNKSNEQNQQTEQNQRTGQNQQTQQDSSGQNMDIAGQLLKGAQGITSSLQNFAASFFDF